MCGSELFLPIIATVRNRCTCERRQRQQTVILSWLLRRGCKRCSIISNADNSWTRAPYTPPPEQRQNTKPIKQPNTQRKMLWLRVRQWKTRNYLPMANPISFLSDALSYQTDVYLDAMTSWRGSKFTFLQSNQLNQTTKRVKERERQTRQTF